MEEHYDAVFEPWQEEILVAALQVCVWGKENDFGDFMWHSIVPHPIPSHCIESHLDAPPPMAHAMQASNAGALHGHKDGLLDEDGQQHHHQVSPSVSYIPVHTLAGI